MHLCFSDYSPPSFSWPSDLESSFTATWHPLWVILQGQSILLLLLFESGEWPAIKKKIKKNFLSWVSYVLFLNSVPKVLLVEVNCKWIDSRLILCFPELYCFWAQEVGGYLFCLAAMLASSFLRFSVIESDIVLKNSMLSISEMWFFAYAKEPFSSFGTKKPGNKLGFGG